MQFIFIPNRITSPNHNPILNPQAVWIMPLRTSKLSQQSAYMDMTVLRQQ